MIGDIKLLTVISRGRGYVSKGDQQVSDLTDYKQQLKGLDGGKTTYKDAPMCEVI